MEVYKKYSPVLWFHIFIEPGKIVIKLLFPLISLFYTFSTLIIFLLQQTGHDKDAKILKPQG